MRLEIKRKLLNVEVENEMLRCDCVKVETYSPKRSIKNCVAMNFNIANVEDAKDQYEVERKKILLLGACNALSLGENIKIFFVNPIVIDNRQRFSLNRTELRNCSLIA